MGRSAGLQARACVLFTSVCAHALLLLGASVFVSVLGRVTLRLSASALARVFVGALDGCVSVDGCGSV